MKDKYILNEDLQEMIRVCSKNKSVSKLTDEKKWTAINIAYQLIESNTHSVGIPIEELYHATRIQCREIGKRFVLSKSQFSLCLGAFLSVNKGYKLKNFNSSGWIILDLYGRTLENSFTGV